MRLTETVRNKLLALNEGFSRTTSFDSKNHSYVRNYLIQDGKLFIKETGKTSWADSRYEKKWVADKSELLNFLRKNIDYLNQ